MINMIYMKDYIIFPKFAGAVTVGERGQIVIPAEVRAQLLKSGPGDKIFIDFYEGMIREGSTNKPKP